MFSSSSSLAKRRRKYFLFLMWKIEKRDDFPVRKKYSSSPSLRGWGFFILIKIFSFFLSKKNKKWKNILLLVFFLRGVLYFHRNFLFLPVKKNNKNIFLFSFSEWEGPLFSIIFSSSSGQKKGKKNYSSSPSLREVLYFHQNFVLLSVEK